jgi:hypothetical protein
LIEQYEKQFGRAPTLYVVEDNLETVTLNQSRA